MLHSVLAHLISSLHGLRESQVRKKMKPGISVVSVSRLIKDLIDSPCMCTSDHCCFLVLAVKVLWTMQKYPNQGDLIFPSCCFLIHLHCTVMQKCSTAGRTGAKPSEYKYDVDPKPVRLTKQEMKAVQFLIMLLVF